jgi:hypothetical protein
MAVLVLFQWIGDTEHLLATYDRELQHPVPREQPRRIAHTCAGTDDGMVIVDVWESEEDLRAAAPFLGELENRGRPVSSSPLPRLAFTFKLTERCGGASTVR